jgi:hypothetical protein
MLVLDEAWQILQTAFRNPGIGVGHNEGPGSGADVGREVLAGEGGADGDEVGGCALEDDPTAVVGRRRDPDR